MSVSRPSGRSPVGRNGFGVHGGAAQAPNMCIVTLIAWSRAKISRVSDQRGSKKGSKSNPKQASKARRAFPKTWLPFERELILAPNISVVMAPAPKSVLDKQFFPKLVARRSPMGAKSSTRLTLFGIIFDSFSTKRAPGIRFCSKKLVYGAPGCELIFEQFLVPFRAPLRQRN